MLDPPVVLAVIEAIFESPSFTCRHVLAPGGGTAFRSHSNSDMLIHPARGPLRDSGYGGDYVLPGCVEYQQLHQVGLCAHCRSAAPPARAGRCFYMDAQTVPSGLACLSRTCPQDIGDYLLVTHPAKLLFPAGSETHTLLELATHELRTTVPQQ